ncbi:SMP-30/gluconolactonase/LRE family protein [Oceanicola sp. 502str15]|uniref:SMP-30/gluconolactonase/LRE family protein n=1 Tax=Oceanicola sp. 502str15 TaxID=2696061 RepID=UPI002094B53E|nr:SMP-30/gluconolactonase/LRE family protein [Oceanicola sp. 502str15]MCO6381479.1 helix-turn-helix domain-containing protein [Oceanicola sp. 502str15]
MAPDETKGAGSLRKALKLLSLVKQKSGGADVRSLVDQSGLTRPTVYRMIAALTEEGFLKQDDSTRKVALGPKFLELAQEVWSDNDLRGAARADLQRLARETGAAALLMVRSGQVASCVELVQGRHGAHGWHLGMARPVEDCAGGLALLAYDDWTDLDNGSDNLAFEARRQLKSRLGVVRSRFYAVDTAVGENSSQGVAAPIFDVAGRPIGALCLYGDTGAPLHEYGAAVVQAARDISKARGGYPFSISLPSTPIDPSPAGVDLLSDCNCLIGDNPCLDGNHLYWIDILGPALYRFDLATKTLTCLHQNEVTGALLRLKPGRFLLAQQTTLTVLDAEGRALEHRQVSGLPPGFRYNDGAVDAAGRIVLGVMDMAVTRGTGMLHCYESLNAAPTTLPGFSLPNGIAFTPDGTRMLVVDSMEKSLSTFAYDPLTGAASLEGRTPLLDGLEGRPSGLTPGPDGTFFICHWDGGAVLQIDQDAQVLATHKVPVPRPSGVHHDAANNRLIVTSARVRLSEADVDAFPHSGSTMTCAL